MAATIAVELMPHRINVNVIEPGWIDTPGERLSFGEEVIAHSQGRRCRGADWAPTEISGREQSFWRQTSLTMLPAQY